MRQEWANLCWEKFAERGGEYFAGRKEKWLEIAEDILNAGINTQLAMETGTGKTIVACLVALGLAGRALVLVPMRRLARQHRKTWMELTGDANNSADITGAISPAERKWNLEGKKIIFATGHVFERDVGRRVFLNDFSLLFIDESHHADATYPYTLIAKMAAGLKLVIVSLSATPGESEAKIEKIAANCFAERVLAVKMPGPRISEDKIEIPTDTALDQADTIFREMFSESSQLILRLGYPADPKKIMDWPKLTELKNHIDKSSEDRYYYKALSEYALYCKLKHLYHIAITESWRTFLDKVAELRFDGTKAADRLLCDPRLKRILVIAKKAPLHPKTAMLLEKAELFAKMRKKTIVFVGEVKTGRYLQKLFWERGIACGLTLGSNYQSERKREKILESLDRGEISAVVSTSVIEEGLSANVDEVLQYSLPSGAKQRQQRRGRTGREKIGHVVFFVLRHPLDEKMYYRVWHRYWGMRKVIYGEEPPWERRKKQQLELAF